MGTVVVLKRTYGRLRVPFDVLEEDSNPTQAIGELSLESVDLSRKVFCRRQTACITFAAARGWTGFVCSACKISETLSRDEQREDLDGLAMLLGAMSGV